MCAVDLNPSTVQATLDACMAILGRPDAASNLALGTSVASVAGLLVVLGLMAAVKLAGWGK